MGKAPVLAPMPRAVIRAPTKETPGGYPCDEEGARFCEIDTAYECQDGQWVFVENCAAPLTCETTTGTCVEKVCDRGDRRCIDGETVQFCKPDQTGWNDPQPCGDDKACVENACVGAECYPGVMFLVDRSTSMGNSWTNVRNSIDSVVQANPSVRFGLTVFPSDADPADGFFGSLSGCVTGYDWPNISMQTKPRHHFTDYFDQNGVKGATPLGFSNGACCSECGRFLARRSGWLSGGALRWRGYLHRWG